MSQDSIDIRPNGEALAALLIIAALGFKSLFSVAKAVGNRFIGSKFKEDECGSDIDEVDLEPEPAEEQSCIEVDRDGTPSIQNDDLRVQDKKDEDSRSIQAEAQPLYTQHHLNREVAFNAIHAWDEDTTSRTLREEAQRLESLPSLDWRELDRRLSRWEPSTEVHRLLPRGRRTFFHEKESGTVNAWEPEDDWDARRDVSQERAMKDARALREAVMPRPWEDEVQREPLRSVEGYERNVQFRRVLSI